MSAELADVEIESITLQGDGVAHIGRTPLTVPFTIPGERTTRGYAIASMQPVDMFPHTPHIETVVLLDRVTR